MASIYDIAERAGVSISTVSRILNGTANVKREKADAVREAMAYFNYEPNQFARGLVKQKSNMIGFYLRSLSDGEQYFTYYNPLLIDSISKVLSSRGYSLVLLYDDPIGSKVDSPNFLEQLKQKKIDGIIFSMLPSSESARRRLSELNDNSFPVVYVGNRYNHYGMNVYAQLEEYMYSSISYLYEKGHRNILVNTYEAHREQIEKVVERATASLAGIKLNLLFSTDEALDSNRLRADVKEYAQKGIDAICGIPVEYYPIVIGALNELRLSIPEDISIVGIEHREGLGELYLPHLSAVHVPTFQIGREVAEMIINKIENPNYSEITREVDSILIERASVLDRN